MSRRLLSASSRRSALRAALGSMAGVALGTRPAEAAPPERRPLRIAYSDWPGWTAFEVGIQKGWFAEAGVAVEFSWFDYLPSLQAYQSGQVDAVTVTNGDALVLADKGSPSKMILINDYSSGNDQIIGRPGIRRFQDLAGKRVGLEFTLVDHLLFLQGLKKHGMKPGDVTLVNIPTPELVDALATGRVDAIGTWYPMSGLARKTVVGSRALFTSADVPGLIYDTLAVRPQSLIDRRQDWAKVVRVWHRICDFVRDPAMRPRAVALMAAKVGVKPEEYAAALPGTYLLSLPQAKQRFTRGPGLGSLYGSTRVADAFNVANEVYPRSQSVDDLIFPDLVLQL